MSKEVFQAAVKLNWDRGDVITLGGGEPTLHPQFWEFFGLMWAHVDLDMPPYIVTNGSNTEISLALASFAAGRNHGCGSESGRVARSDRS